MTAGELIKCMGIAIISLTYPIVFGIIVLGVLIMALLGRLSNEA